MAPRRARGPRRHRLRFLLLAALAVPAPGAAVPALDALGLREVRIDSLRVTTAAGEIRAHRVELVALPDGTARAGAGSVRLTDGPLAPVELRGRVTDDGRRIAWSGDVRLPGGPRLGRLTAHHDRASGTQQVRLDAPSIVLGPGNIGLDRLLPKVAGVVTAASGEIGLRLLLDLARPSADRAELLLRDLSLTLSGVTIQRLNGVVTLTGLRPPQIAEPQELAAALIDVGLPLTAGLVRFRLRTDGGLLLDLLRFDVAGGSVIGGPIEIAPPYRAGALRLTADGLDLGQLVAALAVPDLSAEGQLDGDLPLEIGTAGAITVSGGQLRARGPGTIRWRPAEPPAALAAAGGGGEILLQALQDFHYDSLEMRLDGQTDGEMQAQLAIHGRNPALYDGYPVAFNLNLEGRLAAIVRGGVQSWQLPDTIGARIRDFQRPRG